MKKEKCLLVNNNNENKTITVYEAIQVLDDNYIIVNYPKYYRNDLTVYEAALKYTQEYNLKGSYKVVRYFDIEKSQTVNAVIHDIKNNEDILNKFVNQAANSNREVRLNERVLTLKKSK